MRLDPPRGPAGPRRPPGAGGAARPALGAPRAEDAHSRFRTSAFLRMEEVCSGPLGDFRRETAQGRGMRASGVDRFRRGCRSRGWSRAGERFRPHDFI